MPGDSIIAGGVDEVEPVQQCSTNWANEKWVAEIKNELELLRDDSGKKEKRSVYRVSALLKDLNNKAYEPQMVSFGPYHYGKKHLMPMEKRKHNRLLHFLKESEKPLESYVNALALVVQDLKDCYDELQLSWHEDTSSFLKLMVLDGCFMLHILRESNKVGWPRPVFGDMETAGLKRDMLLLENQLPMLVLVKIVQVQYGGELREESIQELVLGSWGFWSRTPLRMGKCLHVLDMYRKTLIWDEKYATGLSSGRTYAFWSAIELTETGIRLEVAKFDETISFNNDDGVLRLPRLVVDHGTESILLNLIAFDGLHVGGFRGEVTSFIYFMRQLIRSPRDVSVLTSNRILVNNGIGSDEAIFQLFDSLSKEVPILNPYTSKMYFDVYLRIRDYRDRPENRRTPCIRCSRLQREYQLESLGLLVYPCRHSPFHPLLSSNLVHHLSILPSMQIIEIDGDQLMVAETLNPASTLGE